MRHFQRFLRVHFNLFSVYLNNNSNLINNRFDFKWKATEFEVDKSNIFIFLFYSMKMNYTQVNQNGFVYGMFSDMVTKRHLNGRKQTVSIRNFGHSITAPYTAPYFHSDTVTIRLFTYLNGPYYCARKYGPYRSNWVIKTML